MSRTICEHNRFEGKRCRKQARHSVTYMSFFGTNIGPMDATPVFIQKVTNRCDDHKAIKRQIVNITPLAYQSRSSPTSINPKEKKN